MKTLFVNPSLRPDGVHRYLPVGLGYVLTAVKEAGIAFDLLDIDISGMSDAQVESHLKRHRYDVICVGAIVSHYRWIAWFINQVKHHQPHCKVVVGNSVGSSIPEVLFRTTGVDVVILGEADVTIVELLRALDSGKSLGEIKEPKTPVPHTNGDYLPCHEGSGIEGIVFRAADGEIIHNGRRKAVAKLDDLPMPDWDLFDVEAYMKWQRGMAHDTPDFSRDEAVVFPVNTARGCVFKCTFCHHVFWHDPYRRRSPESVIAEMERNRDRYGANYIDFWDELTFFKWKPAEKFIDVLLEKNPGLYWTAAVRSDLFGRSEVPLEDRRRVADKFRQAGCVALGYSLESGNAEILKDMNKRLEVDHFAEQVQVLKEADIVSNTSVVIGYPRETPETIADTMRMCEKAGIYPSVGFLLPLPETGMWNHAVENGFISDIETYLSNMTERQDVVLNMTMMRDETIMSEVQKWLEYLSDKFNTGLSGERLIRTQGYGEHNKHQDHHEESAA